MWAMKECKGRCIAACSGIALVVTLAASPAFSQTEFTAGVVLEKMGPGDRYTFIAGIIEGLAHARYEADGRDTAGRSCIYRWFYEDKSAIDHIEEAFARYPDRLPGSVVGALIQMRCSA